jgi:hypothetical protein
MNTGLTLCIKNTQTTSPPYKYDIIVLYLPIGGTLTYSLERGIKW